MLQRISETQKKQSQILADSRTINGSVKTIKMCSAFNTGAFIRSQISFISRAQSHNVKKVTYESRIIPVVSVI